MASANRDPEAFWRCRRSIMARLRGKNRLWTTNHNPQDRDAAMTRLLTARSVSNHGFTILELLISLALVSLILVVILGGIGSGRLILDQAKQSDAEIEVGATRSLLRNLLAEARPIQGIESGSSVPVVLSGTPNQLTFYSAYTVEAQVGGIYRSTLLLSSDAPASAKFNLVLRQRMHRPATESITNSRIPETTTVLVQGIQGLRLRYYGHVDQGKPEAWYTSWQSPRQLPELIEISLDFSADDGRLWTPIIVSLALQE